MFLQKNQEFLIKTVINIQKPFKKRKAKKIMILFLLNKKVKIKKSKKN